MSLNKFDLNPIFVPYDLPIENIETLGNYQKNRCNYQPSELFGEIKGFNIPPYSLTVDKDKVPEMNLEAPDKDKLFYIDFKYE